MSAINDSFFEAYKQLDKICREALGTEAGVKAYIDIMYNCSDGNRYIADWYYVRNKLKDYKKIRNSYAHDVGTTEGDICVPEDVEWLNSFYQDIMQGMDPLAEYYRLKNGDQVHQKEPEQNTWVVPLADEWVEENNSKPPLNRVYGKWTGWFLVCVLLIVAIFLIVVLVLQCMKKIELSWLWN